MNILRLFVNLYRGKNWIKNLPEGILKISRYHWYIMVTPSPWPFAIGIIAFPGVIGLVGTLQGIMDSFELFVISFFVFIFLVSVWLRDIVRESTFDGLYTKEVIKNSITGFKWFLFSETMLFVTFFWTYLYSALYPSVFIGLSWPPVGLVAYLLDPFDIPLTNTLILVFSGFTVTISHLYLRRGYLSYSFWTKILTIILGFAFLYFQYVEFSSSDFDISDSIYGSTFFILTGFHGSHVMLGVAGLIINAYRTAACHFSSYEHTGFKFGLMYWHFVDIIWIFVFLLIYIIGSDLTYPKAIMLLQSSDLSKFELYGYIKKLTYGVYNSPDFSTLKNFSKDFKNFSLVNESSSIVTTPIIDICNLKVKGNDISYICSKLK